MPASFVLSWQHGMAWQASVNRQQLALSIRASLAQSVHLALDRQLVVSGQCDLTEQTALHTLRDFTGCVGSWWCSCKPETSRSWRLGA